jgi:hypothetical protein
MRILKPGNMEVISAEYKVYCGFVEKEKIPGCGAELLVHTEDIYKTRIMTPNGPGVMYQYTCPHCNKPQVLLPATVATDVTYPWKEEFLKKHRGNILKELTTLVSERTGQFESEILEDLKDEYFIN